ncbi:MAG: hypothetical protein DRP15_03795 [Candidatus Aenigmatarchaeota archaeon]|nr:MAG: hypothetical protein DRP15_03795 [Candidatus Aenigmarchaeota archaeon]
MIEKLIETNHIFTGIAPKEILTGILFVVFLAIGGVIDTYTSYRFFPPKKKPPKWLSNFILVWWCQVYSGLLPCLMVFVASGFQLWVLKVFLTFGILGSVLWDLTFSKIWSGKWISDSCITWFWIKIGKRKINIGFSRKTVAWLHAVRIIMFIVFFVLLF